MPLHPFIIAYLISRKQLFSVEELAQAVHNDKLAAIGILSASINHELRNPLYIIKNFAESLLINSREGVYKDMPSLQSKMNDTLERVVRQSDNAMKIVGRLTAFAKKKSDEGFRMEAVSLPQILADLDILIRCEIEIHKIQIVQDIPENLPLIWADPSHLEEILLNLILNAYQVLKTYSTETHKQIRISAQTEGTDNKSLSVPSPKIQIVIKDNGPGISSEDLPNIFKPFYTRKREGLGLGLYITKQLVEKNQGTIKIQSQIGRGASFILEFQKCP